LHEIVGAEKDDVVINYKNSSLCHDAARANCQCPGQVESHLKVKRYANLQYALTKKLMQISCT